MVFFNSPNNSLGTKELFGELKKTIQSDGKKVEKFYIGYFLQFKRVELIRRRSKHMPTDYSLPYYRCELSLSPNKITRLSQHETLRRLAGIKKASVYYACPMFFDIDDIYKDADLADLRMVPVKSSPTGWLTTQRHFICFKDVSDDTPGWCSEPVIGKSYSVEEWSSQQNEDRPIVMSAADVYEMIIEVGKLINKAIEKRFIMGESRVELLPESLTFIELQRETGTQESV